METWRKGSRHKVDASDAASELRRIAGKFGGIQPGAVVDESRDESAPLHPEFEWRDPVAAEAYRREQARSLINDLVVVESEGCDAAPVFMHVPADIDRPAAYQQAQVVLSNKQLTKAMLAEAVAQFEALLRRYERLKQLALVRRAVRTVKAKFAKAAKKG